MKNNTILINDLKYINEDVRILIKNYTISKDDLYLTIAGTIGKVGIVPYELDNMNLTENAAKLSEINIDKLFLMYFLSSRFVQEQFQSNFHQVAQPKLSLETAGKTIICIPPLSEQMRIVSKIEEIFALIDTIEQDQTDLKTTIEQTKAKVLDMAIRGKLLSMIDNKKTFDNKHYTDEEFPFPIPKHWKWKKLGEVCEFITDGTHQTPKYSDTGYIFLSSKNVTSGKIDWENVKYIGEELHQQLYKRIAPRLNDILLAKNGTTGVAAIVDRDCVFDIYVSLAILRPIENIVLPKYLLNAIGCSNTKNQFNHNLKGIGVPNLHLEHIRKTLIPLPPLEEQQKIVQKIEKIFAELDFIEQNL